MNEIPQQSETTMKPKGRKNLHLEQRIALYLTVPILSLGFGLVMWGMGRYDSFLKHHENLVEQIRPYIEASDGEPGISFQDQLELAKCAGLPSHTVIQGKPLNINTYPSAYLERALATYRRKR